MKRILLLLLCALPHAASADGFGFMTPSGNIYCNGSANGSDISCSIIARSGSTAKPKPANCTTSWGHVISLKRSGPAKLHCGATPETVEYTDIPEYGDVGQFGDITCRLQTTGLTCQNATGNGFFLSRREQEVF